MFNTELLNLLGASQTLAKTRFDYPDQQVFIAERGIKGLAKFEKHAGQRGAYFAYIATVAAAMANQAVMHKAKVELDSVYALVERYNEAYSQQSVAGIDTEAIDAEIESSINRLGYCASNTRSADLEEVVAAYPDQYHIYFSEENATTQVRISGGVGWNNQWFPKDAKLEFKMDCCPLWSTYPTTNPENEALLAFAHLHVNHD